MARLTREKLIRVALDLVDEEGAGSLTMRALASRVGRQVSSLYNHVSSRADLVEGLRERIAGSIDTTSFATQSWDHALVSWSNSYLAAFAAHPNVIPLLATTPIRDHTTLQMYDRVVGALLRQGWPARDAVAVMRTVEAHVLGSALDIAAPGDLLTQSSVPEDLVGLRDALDPDFVVAASAERAFRLGLAALMNGLRAEHERLGRS